MTPQAADGANALSTMVNSIFSGFSDQFTSAATGLAPTIAAIFALVVGVPIVVHFGKKLIH